MNDRHIQQRPVARHFLLGYGVDKGHVAQAALRGRFFQSLLARAVAQKDEMKPVAIVRCSQHLGCIKHSLQMVR